MAKHEELWQEYDLTGSPIGSGRDPQDFYEENSSYLCGVAHVWVYRKTANGIDLLFQKRSHKVDHNPGKWDISAAGHINVGESTLDAAVREGGEEIGIKVNRENLQFVISYFFPLQKSFHTAYLYEWTGDSFDFNDGEVEEVKWVPFDEVNGFVQVNVKKSLAKLDWYWNKLLSNLESL